MKGKRRPVVLYQPRDEGNFMPLGLLALGSHLAGEHVVIVDGRFELAPEARIVELVRDAGCLGITVRTGAPLRDALRVSAAARAVNPRLKVLWGGPHAGLAPSSCLASGVVDACALGAGEQALAGAVRGLRGGRPLETQAGLVVPGATRRGRVPPPESNQVERAAYSLLDLERHFEARGARRLDYCSSRGVREEIWRALPAERVLAEIAELAERYRLSEVSLRDEDFCADVARASAISAGLMEVSRHLGWRLWLRLDDVLQHGNELLPLLAASRCRKVCVAVPREAAPRGPARDAVFESAVRLSAARLPARFELRLGPPGPKAAGLKAAVALARSLCAVDPRFETPLVRLPELPAEGEEPLALEAWAAESERPWPDPRAEARLLRAAFYFAEAQRPPRRSLAQHLLRMLSLLRVRLGVFGLDFERRLVEVAAFVRTGRPRPAPPLE